jgi:predicted metalloprotease with PDZ domain
MSSRTLSTETLSKVDYVVRVLPERHELEVTMTVHARDAMGTLELKVPTWVPGHYAFAPYARDLFDLTAIDPASHTELSVTRDGWQGFRIAGVGRAVTVRYRVFDFNNDLSEDTGLVQETYAVLLGTRYLYLPDFEGPCTVRYEIPEGWAIHHPCGAVPLSERSWEYPSYEILLDTPVVLGRFDLITRNVHGTPIHALFVERGVGFESEVEGFVDKLAAVAESFHGIFGSFPFDDYSFVMSLNPAAEWGLEHLSSSACGLGPDVFTVPDQYAIGVRVCAHEMFHAWNVRRLRPAPLKRLASHLDSGCFTEGMWVAEGFTRYYEFLTCARVGVYDSARFFSNLVGYHRALTARPAYRRVSVLDSSLATYLNHSRYCGRVNNSIDYYDKGMLIAFEIDANLRLEKPGYSLDRAFAELYEAYIDGGAGGSGYTTEDAIEHFRAILPGLGERIEQAIRQPGGLDTPALLARLGFEVLTQPVFQLGLLFRDGVGATVTDVLDDSPAGASGIAPEDVLTTVNGFAFSPQALCWAAARCAPVTLGVMRGHRPLQFTATPTKRRVIGGLVWHGSEAQAALIRDWLNDAGFHPKAGERFAVDFYENFHGIETVI